MTTDIITSGGIEKQIRDRIKASFVELIPEDAWKTLVQKEVAAFQEDKRSYGGLTEPSPLRRLIQTAMTDLFKEAIKQELSKPEYSTNMKGDLKLEPSQAVRDIVKGLLPEIVTEMTGSFVENVVTKLRSNY